MPRLRAMHCYLLRRRGAVPRLPLAFDSHTRDTHAHPLWRARHTAGQGMVEFALVVPLLVLLLFGIIELGMLLSIYVGLTSSAREAARAGSIYQESAPVITAGDVAAMDARRRQYLSTIITDTLTPIVDSTKLTVTVSYTPTTALATNPYRAGDVIAVQLGYDHGLFFGILGPQTITITANSAMRIEPGGVP